ncbi:glycoside hydrolase family 3 N-terminal domain-containing protein [Mycolicibacterium sp.]|uniref:glycoside hydrolase family 3 N-terminal domain-containing protein n=1 Tax=Mycolicibacterium sp. TaxID=2320850 RepID=UPI0025F31354|nr:glycoside hydrolase family 3 N-terminal domain-containing protein [Mycolicibacterium sp.]MCB9409363.1 glycoside hydrolase family 3 protein [Mycolicibacterium sp.]
MKRRTVIGIGLAVAIVAGGVVAGTYLGKRTDRAAPAASQPTSFPAEIPRTLTPTTSSLPIQPGCPDPSQLSRLPLRDKLAQLLMVGVEDEADARSVVANYRVGGIFIASWTDLSMLTNGALTQLATTATPLPLLVSVDEEGGRVSRLSALIGPSPSARVLAQSESPEQVYQLALSRGNQMRSLGINVDFAPVVDVTAAPDETVIGDRSFGDNPDVVTRYAGAYARGLRDAGLLPVLKHFPGHGNASGDSHQTDVVTPPLGQLLATDLVPYRSLVAEAPVGVMMGHMQVPGLTGSDQASLSRPAVSLLRDGTGYNAPPFDGPVFTDDLSTMKAITDRYSVPEAVLKALQAGVDVALWVSTAEVPAVLDRLESAVDNGELDVATVDASVARVAAAKAPLAGCFR